MASHHKKSGQFCSKQVYEKTEHVTEAAPLKWSNYRQEHIVKTVDHDHDYSHFKEIADACDKGLDVCEEVVGSMNKCLPKNVIPIDKYQLIVELGYVVKQLKAGCTNCRLPLNIL